MEILAGKGACPGIAIGRIYYIRRKEEAVKRRTVKNAAAEILRAEKARARAIRELDVLHRQALGAVGEKEASLFGIHQMMLQDPDYWGSVSGIIEQHCVNTEYAVKKTSDDFVEIFSQMEDPYMRARAADVKDVSERMLRLLQGGEHVRIQSDEPVIVAADDLAPSETVQLDRNKILAFVTAKGSVHSHASILARTLGIPAVVGVGAALNASSAGEYAIVDGISGRLYLDPDSMTDNRMRLAARRLAMQQARLLRMRDAPDVTQDGREVMLYANITGPKDLPQVHASDARGIGLYRTEFLFMGRDGYPDEQTQFEAYQSVVRQMEGRRVVMRTMDLGAEKNVPFLGLQQEKNPALGMRGARISLEDPRWIKPQLRAMLRTSAFGKVAILFPMVCSQWELRACRELVEEARGELRAEGQPMGEDVEVGVMIETPAAAVLSDVLAQDADFFNIGTNDLTQYLLAVDRQDMRLARYSDPHHPALLRMMATIVENAHAAGIWVGVCGELAADLEMTETLLAMGVDELSVSPSFVLPLRQKIRELDMGRTQNERPQG